MTAKKAECRKSIAGRFLLADVAVALGVAHVKALAELESLLDVCPALIREVEPVTAHPTRGGRWEDTYSITAMALFAFIGFAGIRKQEKLMQGVFAHPKEPLFDINSDEQELSPNKTKKGGE